MWICTHFAEGILTSLTTEFCPGCCSVESVYSTEDRTYLSDLKKKKQNKTFWEKKSEPENISGSKSFQ